MAFEEDIAVFVFTGFLESGKTNAIKEWLSDEYFDDGRKTVVIVCEEGIEDYDEKVLAERNISVIRIDSMEQFNSVFLKDIQEKYRPSTVMIEHSCSASLEDTFDIEFPESWYIEDVVTTIDSSTFDMYSKNMGKMMFEQYKYASLVIFNRCDENTKKVQYRANIKATNPMANIIFMNNDGEIENIKDIMPFDVNADVIEVSDIDYGLWYIDAIDNNNIDKYSGKKIKFRLTALRPEGFPQNAFVAGRKAMTCCADDIALLKVLCLNEKSVEIKNNEWYMILAEIEYRNGPEPNQKVPVLNVLKAEHTDAPDVELVYFS